MGLQERHIHTAFFLLQALALAVHQIKSRRYQSMSDCSHSEWVAILAQGIVLQGVTHCKKHIANQEQNLEDEVLPGHGLPL